MEAAAVPVPGGGPGPLLLCLALASGLALFSCVGADANITEGLPCEGCAGSGIPPSPPREKLMLVRRGVPSLPASPPIPAQPLSFIPGLALFSCVGADANITEGLPCEGCAGNVTQLRRRGHFSRCPEEYRHYCVKGRCRFLVAEAAPACICERGYTGARCEQVDIFYLRGDRGQIVVISLIAAIVTLIVFIICACLCAQYVVGPGWVWPARPLGLDGCGMRALGCREGCGASPVLHPAHLFHCCPLKSHCRKQRRKRKEEEMETLNKNVPSRSEDVPETDVA
ncbi:UNVERIFIED_CONTAM: hypothetical protein H355_013300 [Colinus virginianus]|nr:hypothetical protein H355_013300 [Colinus virginianus]